MTHSERLALMKDWYEKSMTLHEAEVPFREVLGIHDAESCEILKVAWELYEAYTEAVSAYIGDTYSWLGWFWYDNERGARGHEITTDSDGKTRCVRTVEDLCDVIEAGLTKPTT